MSNQRERIINTIAYLRRCQQARAAGLPVAYTTDPEWLIQRAINRRAGWLEEQHFRGTHQPCRGKVPRKAEGNAYRHLRQLADRINTPRLVVREGELGEWRGLLLARIPERITRHDMD